MCMYSSYSKVKGAIFFKLFSGILIVLLRLDSNYNKFFKNTKKTKTRKLITQAKLTEYEKRRRNISKRI
jgi:hypothetical protein